MADLVNVNVKIGGTTQSIKMEKGVTFENKGGIYTVDENGQLKKFDKKANVWTDASKIEMTNYQWKAFQNISNNDGDTKSYTKADIEKAQELYKAGKFTADMSDDLPTGYKIEKPKLDSKQDYVQVDVTNGKENQSATLKFQIQEIEELKAASKAREAKQTQKAEENKPVTETTKTEKTKEAKGPKALVGASQELVDGYATHFENMSPENIAKTLVEQIKGLSGGEKTLSMFDAIPKDKLMKVIDLYQENTKEPLFTAMSNEWGIGGDELKARINAYVDYCVNIPWFDKDSANLNELSDAVEKLDIDKVNEELYKSGLISSLGESYDTEELDELLAGIFPKAQSRQTEVSEEDMKALGENGFSMRSKLMEYCKEYLEEDDFEYIKSYEGEPITADSIDKIVSFLADKLEDHEGILVAKVGRFAEYLKPKTMDKLFEALSDHYYAITSIDVDAQDFYNRLSPSQKREFIENATAPENSIILYGRNYGEGYSGAGDIMFESKLSNRSFIRIKQLVSQLKKLSYAEYSGKPYRQIVDRLIREGKLTKAQEQELRKYR